MSVVCTAPPTTRTLIRLLGHEVTLTDFNHVDVDIALWVSRSIFCMYLLFAR